MFQGPVSFDANGDREGLTRIEQLQGNSEVRVGVFQPTEFDQNPEIQWETDSKIIWRGK